MFQHWKIILVIGMVAVIISDKVLAQTERLPNWKNRRGFIGLAAGELSEDVSVGIEATLRPLFKGPVCLKLKGNINWLEKYKATYDRWAIYSTLSASAVMYRTLHQRTRAYMEVGPYVIIPSRKISQRRFMGGASGSIGLELFVFDNDRLNICYYFGGGIAYCRARAEKIDGGPSYGSGIIFNNGFRFYF